MRISDVLADARQRLSNSSVAEAPREASSLLVFALGRDRTFLITNPDYELTPEESLRFEEFIARRARREPFQYITGRQEFFGLDFRVTPDVLIPRPETELLVEAAIRILEPQPHSRFCEIGVGSGCISISMLRSLPGWTALGLEVSPEAAAVAKLNADTFGVSDRFDVKVSDLFEAGGKERFAMIVSNPPYVPLDDMATLQQEVGRFEPRAALTDESDGLSIIRRIVEQAPEFLSPGGWLLLEIGFGQHEKVAAMFDPESWPAVELLPDLQGIPRTVVARFSSGGPAAADKH
jgi:release factor glutamine methyltransferase